MKEIYSQLAVPIGPLKRAPSASLAHVRRDVWSNYKVCGVESIVFARSYLGYVASTPLALRAFRDPAQKSRERLLPLFVKKAYCAGNKEKWSGFEPDV